MTSARAIPLFALALATACGTRSIDATPDAAVDSGPAIPAECVPTPARLDVPAAPDCSSCAQIAFSEGLSCFDVPVGLECESGDHPAWECNDVWRCDEDQHWTKVHDRRSDRACSRDIFVGGSCEDQTASWLPCYPYTEQNLGRACFCDKAGGYRHDTAILWQDGTTGDGVYIDRQARLGCECKLSLCLKNEQCVDGRYRRFEDPKCPIPP